MTVVNLLWRCGLLIGLCWLLATPLRAAEAQPPGALWILTLDDAVGPATADYLVRGLNEAVQADAVAVLVRINTPGGLDSAMRQMIAAILAAPVPVICHVAPGGARAASAGTFLLYACHVAAMAPATNLGAASPVAIGTPLTPAPEGRDPPPPPGDAGSGDQDRSQQAEPTATPTGSVMERKVTNDAVAYIRALAELRGRNADWAELAVREGASLSAQRALEMKVIDLVAADTPALLAALADRSIRLNGVEVNLDFTAVPQVTLDPDWRNRFLAVITNPNVAYVLMLMGLYGLIFELSNPGFGLPGVIGAICLLVALYAFQVLPVSYAGLGLMVLGIGLIAAEAVLPSVGVLGVGGLIAFVVGSIMLMDTDLPAFRVALPVIAALAVSTAAILFGVLGMALGAQRRPQQFGPGVAIGRTLVIEQVSGEQALARFEGELWAVRCAESLKSGDHVRVQAIDGLTLAVDKLEA